MTNLVPNIQSDLLSVKKDPTNNREVEELIELDSKMVECRIGATLKLNMFECLWLLA